MIIVFGAAGFIGAYLVDELIQQGCRVTATDFSPAGEAYYGSQGVPYCTVDITRAEDFERLPTEGVDAVVHLACAQPVNIADPSTAMAQYCRVNVLGTLNVLDYCRANAIPRIVYTCSHRNTQGMWAQKSGRPIRESDGRAVKFTGEYAAFSISESAACDCVEHYDQAYGLEGVILRLPPVYGYGPHLEGYRDGRPQKTGLQVFIERAQEGLPLEVWGDADAGRDIVYVRDVTRAIREVLAAEHVRGLYNISSGRLLTLREQAETIARVFSPAGRASEIVYASHKDNQIEQYVYAIDKARVAFGWRPLYSFEDMLVDYAAEMRSGRFAFLVEKRKRMMQDSERGS